MHRNLSILLVLLVPLLTQCSLEAEKTGLRGQNGGPGGTDTKAVLRQIDFLYVLDNSTGMRNRNRAVAEHLEEFLQTAGEGENLSLRMAVTTTDYFSLQGALVGDTSGRKVVETSTAADAARDLASIIANIDYNTTTSFWEQGLESAYQAIEKHGAEFSRPGVPLVVLFATDEQDYSCSSNCFGSPPESPSSTYVPFPVSRYVSQYQALEAKGNKVWAFPIVAIPGGTCINTTVGARYISVQESLSRGTSESVCDSDFLQSYLKIAEQLKGG